MPANPLNAVVRANTYTHISTQLVNGDEGCLIHMRPLRPTKQCAKGAIKLLIQCLQATASDDALLQQLTSMQALLQVMLCGLWITWMQKHTVYHDDCNASHRLA